MKKPTWRFNSEVYSALCECVLVAHKKLEGLPSEDIKMVFSPMPNGGGTHKLINYKGFLTAIQLSRIIEQEDSYSIFVSALTRHHPGTFCWLGTWASGVVIRPINIIAGLAFQLQGLGEKDVQGKLEMLLADVESLVARKTIEMSFFAPLVVLSPDPITDGIDITPNLKLRPITKEEYESFFSYDVSGPLHVSMPYGPVTMVLEGSFLSDLYLSSGMIDSKKLDAYSEICHWGEQAQQIMHLFKGGIVNIFSIKIRPISNVLPIAGSSFSGTGSVGFLRPYSLENRELAELGRLAHRINKFYKTDRLLQWLLRFYTAARLNVAAELVFLFDIIEALESFFGSRARLASETGVSSAKIRMLGRLANKELFQGRHKGQNYDIIRDATEQELADAREIARELILEYLNFLERHEPQSRK